MSDKATVARNLLDTYSTRELADLLAECFFTEANLHGRLEQAEARVAEAEKERDQFWARLSISDSRVAELEEGLVGIKASIETEHPEHLDAAIESINYWMGQSSCKAYALRKQAEAVESWVNGFGNRDRAGLTEYAGGFCDGFKSATQSISAYAQHLHKKADEAEKENAHA